jgi:hypothetical protein
VVLLCFSGGFDAQNIELPIINEGDYIVIQDSAYTFCVVEVQQQVIC